MWQRTKTFDQRLQLAILILIPASIILPLLMTVQYSLCSITVASSDQLALSSESSHHTNCISLQKALNPGNLAPPEYLPRQSSPPHNRQPVHTGSSALG